jgi:hypothetical protein
MRKITGRYYGCLFRRQQQETKLLTADGKNSKPEEQFADARKAIQH